MNGLKELSFVFIVGCLAVLAAASEQVASDSARFIGNDGQDLRLLINPFAFLQTRTTTAKPERPQTIVVSPYYHHPHYSNDTFHATKPTVPPTHSLIYPQHPPIYSQHPQEYSYYHTFGSYSPWMYPQQHDGQVPYIVFIHLTPNVPIVPLVPATKPFVPLVPLVPATKPIAPLVPLEPAAKPNVPIVPLMPAIKPKRSGYPYLQNFNEYEDFQDPEEVTEEQQAQNDNEDELVARNIKLDGVSTGVESAEDTDTLIVDTKDIKLPLGLHLAGNPVLGRNIKNQVALIYLRNFKKSRKLK